MIIEINNLVKRYGDLIALDHFNLAIEEGEIFGLLGPNGSGKSTAISCILSLLTYDKGDITVFGQQMTSNSYDMKKDIGIVLQNVAVFDELTVYENIDYFCGLYVTDKQKRKRLVNEAIEFVALQDFMKYRPKKLSGGLLRRLNIACGIAHKPKLIIFDEPTVAVDPQSRNNILDGIKKLNQEGATILYTSHYMEEVEQICTNIAIMDKGKVIATGDKNQLKNMISLGERIQIKAIHIDDTILEEINSLTGIMQVEYIDDNLEILSAKGKNNLKNILDYLQAKNINYGKLYTEQPTLNDVFLEITGKQLRD